jgi:hypothetical protein
VRGNNAHGDEGKDCFTALQSTGAKSGVLARKMVYSHPKILVGAHICCAMFGLGRVSPSCDSLLHEIV